MMRLLALLFGIVAYAVFFVTFLYAIGFVGNVWVPKSIDSGEPGTPLTAFLINSALLLLFALQHSIMARIKFKKWWTKFVSPAIERSVFVLLASLILALTFWQWRPMPAVVWDVQSQIGQSVLLGLFIFGWLTVLIGTFLINHFELFGLAQVFRYFQGLEPENPTFKVPILYKVVRHPIMLGFIIAFWATPTMTVGHLLFAVLTTLYILVAVQFEEKDLVEVFGEKYSAYRKRVWMIIPLPPRK